MYADLHCAHLLYKTNAQRCIGLWSLQVYIQFAQCVAVAIVRLDFKSLFYSDRAAGHICDLWLPQEDVVAIFRYLFLLWNEELPGLKSNLWMLWHLNQRLNVKMSCRNQSLETSVLCCTENAKSISRILATLYAWTLSYPVFGRRSCPFNIPWVKLAVVGSVGSLKKEHTGIFYNHRLGMWGFIAGEGEGS